LKTSESCRPNRRRRMNDTDTPHSSFLNESDHHLNPLTYADRLKWEWFKTERIIFI